MSEEEPKKSEAVIDLQQPLLSGNEEEPILAAPVAEEVNRTTDAVVVEQPHVPTEKWRDGFCNCCAFGLFHPSFLFAYFCPLVAIGQVMSRVNLFVTGSRATKEGAKKQLYALIGITVLLIILNILNFLVGLRLSYEAAWIVVLIYLSIIVLARMAIRKRDNIPSECCGALEDCCASCCCTFCVTSQLMRHTADYQDSNHAWFTSTGLPVEDSV